MNVKFPSASLLCSFIHGKYAHCVHHIRTKRFHAFVERARILEHGMSRPRDGPTQVLDGIVRVARRRRRSAGVVVLVEKRSELRTHRVDVAFDGATHRPRVGVESRDHFCRGIVDNTLRSSCIGVV